MSHYNQSEKLLFPFVFYMGNKSMNDGVSGIYWNEEDINSTENISSAPRIYHQQLEYILVFFITRKMMGDKKYLSVWDEETTTNSNKI